MKTKCEGFRRRGGAFTLGPTVWEQCQQMATVMLTVIQKSTSNKPQTFPACQICLNEAQHTKGISVVSTKPIKAK